MYDKIQYFDDGQEALFNRFIATPKGHFFVNFRYAAFFICIALAATAVYLYISARKKQKTEPSVTQYNNRGDTFEYITIGLGTAALAFIYFFHPIIAFDYMDFSYLGESQFSGFGNFLIKRYYFSNYHTPGYPLFICLLKLIVSDPRPALLLANFIAVALTIRPFYRLLAKNITPASSCITILAFILCPVTVYCLFRTSPYIIVASLNVAMFYSFASFTESKQPNRLATAIASAFILQFLHVYASVSVAILAICLMIYRKQLPAENKSARLATTSFLSAAAGSFAFNTAFIPLFGSDIIAVSAPATTRLNVYFQLAGGNSDFLLLSAKIVLNLYLSFLSTNPLTAILSGALLIIGVVTIAFRGKFRIPLILSGLLSGMLLIVPNLLNNKNFNGYPMSYRHLVMLAPFFIYLLFAGADRIGEKTAEITSNRNIVGPVFCAFLLVIYILHFPGTINSLRKPDMLPAIKYVFDNLKDYDGIIPGNVFFMDEYQQYFLSRNSDKYTLKIQYPASQQTSHYCQWSVMDRPGTSPVKNILNNISPLDSGPYPALLKNNFIKRVWYLDNDTRIFGVFPDISNKYKDSIKMALEGARSVKNIKFRGVTLRLYEIEHSPAITHPDGVLRIISGVNDYFFIRGTLPDPKYAAPFRYLLPNSELALALSSGVRSMKVTIRGEECINGLLRLVDASGISYSSEGSTNSELKYSIPIAPDTKTIRLKFSPIGKVCYKEIFIEAL